MSKIIATFGIGQPGNTDNTPFYSAALTTMGTAQFTNLIPLQVGNRVARFVRVHGNASSIAGGGTITIYNVLIADGVKPSAGAGTGNNGTIRVTYGSPAAAIFSVIATTDAYFSAVIDMNASGSIAGGQIPFPARHMSLRISNPTTAYTGGTFNINTVEILD